MRIWPRDELAFYDNPVLLGETAFNAAVNLIVPADPDRRYLIICSTGAGIAVVTPALAPAAGVGISLVPNEPRLELSWDLHGPLVTYAWFKVLPATDTVSSLSVVLRRNPQEYGYPQAYLNRSPSPERGAYSSARRRSVQPGNAARRSGLYSRIARTHPDLWE